VTLSDEGIKFLMQYCDKDGNGTLSFEEFKKLYHMVEQAEDL